MRRLFMVKRLDSQKKIDRTNASTLSVTYQKYTTRTPTTAEAFTKQRSIPDYETQLIAL
jgi:hypothetical protein